MRFGAVILCGGKSSRMGRDKASLPFGPETMLQRIVRLVGEVVEPRRIVVVAAIDQALPSLPREVVIAHDERPERGPLEGISAGLAALGTAADGGRADAAYVTSCDVPLLVPAFVTRLFAELGEAEIAVPRVGDREHPLTAVYRTTVLPAARCLLAADRRRVRYLFDEVATRFVPDDVLRSADPQLRSLENLNGPDDYRRALQLAGFDPPAD